MAAPVLKSFAQRLYDALAPVAVEDASYNYALANFCSALGNMFQVVDDYSRDQLVGGKFLPGWSQLLDINRAPTEVLQWLGQFVGVVVPTGIPDANARILIKSVGGFSRGTPASLMAAAQQYLTGTKRVTFREREGGDAYLLGITVKTSETPDSSKVLAAILAQLPAGIILDFNVLAGQDYAAVYNAGATTYSNVFTTYANYQNLLDGITGNVPTGGTYGTSTYGSGAYGG